MARLLLALAILGNFFELLSFPPIAHADSPPSDGSSTQNQIGNKHPFIYKTPLTVDLERTSWSGSQTIVDAVGARQPTRFRSSSVANWSALKWDFWELSSRWSILLDVLVLNHPLFIFSEDGKGLVGQDENNSPQVIPETLFTIFLEESPNPDIFLFYSTNYAVMESLAQLQEETSWKDFRIIESFPDVLRRLNLSEKVSLRQPSPTLSIAHPGVTLQSRYQTHHTIRTQLVGRTRYVLFSPAKQSSLFLYPAIHSNHQQSQVVLEEEYVNVASSDLPLDLEDSLRKFLKVPTFAIELTPGESLYIPPYWLVRVENIELSMYLDVRSLSQEQVLLSEAQSLGIILGNVSSPDDKIVAAQVYAVHFLSRIHDLKSPENFARNHYLSRYSRLYPSDGLFMTKMRNTFHCHSDNQTLHDSVFRKLDREGIKRSAQYAADRVNDPAISRGVKWIWVGDYLDLIARWAMNDPKHAVVFITTCLNFDSKIQIVEEVHGPPVMSVGRSE